MSEDGKLKALEGLGYTAALMIGIGSLPGDFAALRYFNVFGLVFAIIVIVRLMVMSLRLGKPDGFLRPGIDGDADLDTQTISEMTELDELIKISR